MSAAMKAAAIRIVKGTLGDDLERAEFAFSKHTPEEMQEEFGVSGQTCQEILDDYRRDREMRKAVIRWLEGVPA